MTNPTVAVSGWYVLEFTSFKGCSDRDSVFVDYRPIPSGADVEASVICEGQQGGTIIAWEVYDGVPPYSYQLRGPRSGTNSTGYFDGLPEGAYSLVIIDANNCSWDTTLTILTAPPLSVDLGTDIEMFLGDTVLLSSTVNVQDSLIRSYQWGPTIWLSCATCPETGAFPEETTTYNLTVTDIFGCEANDDIQLFVDERGRIYIPTVFSPNGDGINDFFTIFSGEGVDRVSYLRIYDRWGEFLFENTDFSPNDEGVGWDGTFRGKPMNPQVLVYYTEVIMTNGRRHFFKGGLTLMR